MAVVLGINFLFFAGACDTALILLVAVMRLVP
jgi:hypothetical protein